MNGLMWRLWVWWRTISIWQRLLIFALLFALIFNFLLILAVSEILHRRGVL